LTTTDRYNMRYELIGDLLGVLEENGHNIGGLVFAGNTTSDTSDAAMESGFLMQPILLSLDEPAPDGREPKDYLLGKIQEAGIDNSLHGCTDIGTALLVAERMLQEKQAENGLESLIFLFSDGLTAFYNQGKADEVFAKSESNRETATREMSENGIRLFGAYLHSGDSTSGGALRSNVSVGQIVCAANGVNSSSEVYSKSYVELTNAQDCHKAVDLLLKFLGIREDDPELIQIDLNNPWTDTFTIPGMGVESMTIRLYSQAGSDLPNMVATFVDPEGNTITDSQALSVASRTYRQYRIDQPQSGKWTLTIALPANEQIGKTVAFYYDPILSISLGASVTASPDFDALWVNGEVEFTAHLTKDGTAITDPAAYAGYACSLDLVNLDTLETTSYDVQQTSGALCKTFPLDTYGSFKIRPVFSCGEYIKVVGDYRDFSVVNHAPEAQSPLKVSMVVNPYDPVDYTVDLLDYVSDMEDGKNLTITLTKAEGNESAYELNGSTLLLKNDGIQSGTLRFEAADSRGVTAALEVIVSVSHAPEVQGPLEVSMKVDPFNRVDYTANLSDYVNDAEDGKDLTISLESAESNEAAYEFDGSRLLLKNDAIASGVLSFAVTDSEGNTVPLDVIVTVTDITIWYIVGAVVLIVLIITLILLKIYLSNIHRPQGDLTAKFTCGEDQELITLMLAVPGWRAKSKNNLYDLVKRALRERSFSDDPHASLEAIQSDVDGLVKEMKKVGVCAATKRVKGKTEGAIAVKQKGKTVLFNSSTVVNVGTKTVSIAFYKDSVPSFENTEDPFGGTQRGGKSNPFDQFTDQDNPFGSGASFGNNPFTPFGEGQKPNNPFGGTDNPFSENAGTDGNPADTPNPFGENGFSSGGNPFGGSSGNPLPDFQKENGNDTFSDLF
ncbi:MAG: hypothetical protein ACI3XG_04095, partial [Faecousia sp.]